MANHLYAAKDTCAWSSAGNKQGLLLKVLNSLFDCFNTNGYLAVPDVAKKK